MGTELFHGASQTTSATKKRFTANNMISGVTWL